MGRNSTRFPHQASFIWPHSLSQSAWSDPPTWSGQHRENPCVGRGWPRWPISSSSPMPLVILKHIPEHALAVLNAHTCTEQCGMFPCFDRPVWRCAMKMHLKYGPFSRRSWGSCECPMAKQSILAELQSIKLSLTRRWREACYGHLNSETKHK